VCYFNYSPLLSDQKVKISDAIVAWKVLRLRYSGALKSPAQMTDWTPQKPMRARSEPTPNNNIGVYAFEHSKDAHGYDQRADAVVVMLMLWGRVLHYDARRSANENPPRYKAGYRAQRAEIHEIFVPAGLRYPVGVSEDQVVGLLVENWRGHGVKIVRSFPGSGRRRKTLLHGTEPMEIAA
jgi:hypothetical protein